MGNTLVDEPVPPTLSEPGVGDRPTLDDVPAVHRPTVDDVPPGARRGPSPTLVDGAPKRPSPTLPDGPPPRNYPTPAAAPLYVVPASEPAPATPPQEPLIAALPQQPIVAPAPAAPQQPVILPASARAAVPKDLVATQPSQPSPAASGAPPPLAYPTRAASAGLLAQIPAMPAARPAPAPPAAPPEPAAPPPEPAPAQVESVPAPVESMPVLTPAREAIPAPAPVVSPPEAAAPAPAPVAAPAPAPMRLAPGARTLVGVAPASPPAAIVQEGSGQFRPPGQTRTPSPHDPTLPVTNAVEAPPKPGEGAASGAEEQAPSAGDAAAGDADDAGDATRAPWREARPRSRARTVLAVLFALIGVLAIAGVTIGYFVFWRYTPHADRHIPGASNLAFRADLRAIGTFAPVRKRLWPVLFERPSQKVSGKTLADRVGEATGIRPAIDAREVIVASVDAKSWVVLVGGNFKPGVFVTGVEKVLRDEGMTGWQKNGDLLIGPGGMAVAQADDGTLVLGTEAEIVNSALPASDENKRVGLPKEAALAFAVSKEAWEELSHGTGAFDPGGALRRIHHATGTLTLGEEPAIDVGIEPKGGENAEALGRDIEQLLSLARLGLVAVPDQMGEKTALSSAKVSVEEGRVHVRGPWPLEGIDRGCEKLAERLGTK